MWLVCNSDTRHEGETVLERSGPVRGQCHNESNGDTSVALKKKNKRRSGRPGQGGCETGEQKGFPSYCFITLAGTAVGAVVSL